MSSDIRTLSKLNLYVIFRPFRYERVYLPLCKVADTPFHIQGDDLLSLFAPRLCQTSRGVDSGHSPETVPVCVAIHDEGHGRSQM